MRLPFAVSFYAIRHHLSIETPAAAAAAQANSSPEPATKERELQTQLTSKESEIRRLNDRLVTMCEQAAETGRLQCELQQEKSRVTEFQSDVQELQRQLMLQKDEANAQILQVTFFFYPTKLPASCEAVPFVDRARYSLFNMLCVQASARMLELQSQVQTLKQRCEVCEHDAIAKTAEAAAARAQSSEQESRMNAVRRQLENSQLQLQVAQANESDMKRQLEAERKLHLVDAQAAEEMKQFTRKVYGVLKEGAMMLEKVLCAGLIHA